MCLPVGEGGRTVQTLWPTVPLLSNGGREKRGSKRGKHVCGLSWIVWTERHLADRRPWEEVKKWMNLEGDACSASVAVGKWRKSGSLNVLSQINGSEAAINVRPCRGSLLRRIKEALLRGASAHLPGTEHVSSCTRTPPRTPHSGGILAKKLSQWVWFQMKASHRVKKPCVKVKEQKNVGLDFKKCWKDGEGQVWCLFFAGQDKKGRWNKD